MNNRALTTGTFGDVSSADADLQEERWRIAVRCALANCLAFLVMAAFIYALKPQSLAMILFAPAVFFAGSLLTFSLMVQGGAALAPIAWFVLGAGIYFGLGSVAGGLHVHPYSDRIFGTDTLYLIHINLLNASSVLIVVVVALTYYRLRISVSRAQGGASAERDGLLQKLFPYVLAFAVGGVCLKFVFFPIAENLLLRSVMGKIHLFVPACFLLLGMLWQRIGWQLKAAALIVFILEILNGLMAFSKYQILYAMLALVMGMWMIRTTWKSMFLAMTGLALVLAVINPLITLGRAHLIYDAQKNTLTDRADILGDAYVAYWISEKGFSTLSYTETGELNLDQIDIKEMGKPEERLRALGRRFDVASIQGYLINEYNSGRPGNTLSNFWVTFIPRMFWSEKPVITNLGGELNAQYYNDPRQAGSALAPTYSAEAYWNYGASGVVLVSMMLGLAIGWLTHYSFLAVSGARPEYFIIAFPAAIWACFVESWLVSSYLGEFVIFVVILIITHIMMKYRDYLKHKKAWRSHQLPTT